jgi:superfamily II DNA or RNA helicase
MTDYTAYKRVLTSRGYAILKSSLKSEEQQKIRQELTVAPQTTAKFGGATGTPFTVYAESSQRFYLPRHWARVHYGIEEADAMPEGLPLPTSAKFAGKPFDYQEKILAKFFEASANGLICVPCGKGKTFMALAIASRIGKRFLVVVDKEFLLNQWRGEINTFFPGLRIGILQGNRCEVDPEAYDCTLCMMQTLVQRDTLGSSLFKTYGFCIFDECHHLGASNFSQALLKIQTKTMLGLSATPTRDDGLSKVFHWYLGEPVYWEKKREADPTVQVRVLHFSTRDTAYSEEPLDFRGEIILARLLSQVVACATRNQMIVKEIKELASSDELRRILVLSERKGHLEELERLLEDSGLTMSYYVGGMKEEVREEGAKTARVLLATYAMASEAMNIRSLNTVLLASPRKKVEQSVGRVLRERPSERKVIPMIVDILDMHGVYNGQYRKRRAFYKSCGYTFSTRVYKDAELEDDEEESVGSDEEEAVIKSEYIFMD